MIVQRLFRQFFKRAKLLAIAGDIAGDKRCSDSSSNELNSLPSLVTRDIAGGKDFFTKVYYPVMNYLLDHTRWTSREVEFRFGH